MPSKSKKQRRKIAVLHDEGKITDTEWEHFKVVKPSGKGKCNKKKGR